MTLIEYLKKHSSFRLDFYLQKILAGRQHYGKFYIVYKLEEIGAYSVIEEFTRLYDEWAETKHLN